MSETVSMPKSLSKAGLFLSGMAVAGGVVLGFEGYQDHADAQAHVVSTAEPFDNAAISVCDSSGHNCIDLGATVENGSVVHKRYYPHNVSLDHTSSVEGGFGIALFFGGILGAAASAGLIRSGSEQSQAVSRVLR